jgi:hypothetical protein
MNKIEAINHNILIEQDIMPHEWIPGLEEAKFLFHTVFSGERKRAAFRSLVEGATRANTAAGSGNPNATFADTAGNHDDAITKGVYQLKLN